MTLKEAIAYLNQMKKDAYGYTEYEKDVEAITIANKSMKKEYVKIGTLMRLVQLVLSENMSEAAVEAIMDELESRIEKHCESVVEDHLMNGNENNVHTNNS